MENEDRIQEIANVLLLKKHISGNSEISRACRKQAADYLGVIILDEYRRAKNKDHLNSL